MTVGSLFSGIGGLDLGLERAGMRVLWQAEIDPFCRAVLHKHWPSVPCYEDIREIGPDAPPVDLICGGFPCQPVSRAGRRRGSEDEKWLWEEFARIVCELQPRYVFVENVPTLKRRGLDKVLGDLALLGYDAEWDCFTAASFGAPHIRDRLFLLAYPSSGRQGSSEEALFAGRASPELCPWWADEPDVDRVAHGAPARLDRDRRKALGNAVVPQIAEYVGRLILEAEKA